MDVLKKLVYAKYDSHCAYCGIYLDIEDMEIDHFFPKAKGGSENIENLMPSCHVCNRYKDSDNIHQFRHKLKKVSNRIRKQIMGEIAERHGMIELKEFDQFYFEKVDGKII